MLEEEWTNSNDVLRLWWTSPDPGEIWCEISQLARIEYGVLPQIPLAG